jgi:hypothetical protein
MLTAGTGRDKRADNCRGWTLKQEIIETRLDTELSVGLNPVTGNGQQEARIRYRQI